MAKTVLLARNASSYDFGGGERVPVVIASELKTLGYNPIVVSRSAKLLDYAKEKNLPIIRSWWWGRQDWSGWKNVLLPFYAIWQIGLIIWYLLIIKKTKAAIVHVMSKDDFIAGTVAARILSRKVLWSDYADLKYIYLNNQVWYKNPVGKLVFYLSKYASSILLTSENDKHLIEDSLGYKLPSQYTVVYYGVTSEVIKAVPRPEEDRSAVVFVATSRLVDTKGIGELIEAFNTLSKQRSDLRLWLFGEGPDEQKFKEAAKLSTYIKFWGYPLDSLNRTASCDVFVHPSYLEGFSISLVEAAKLGLPIIACDVGGNPELIKPAQNGILVDVKDVTTLVAAMKQMADDAKLRTKLGTNGRRYYLENLTFENIVRNKIAPLYEK